MQVFILHNQSDCWIVGKTLKNQACVWDFDHLSTLVWDHWLRDLLSAPYLDQSVNQLDQFNSRTLLEVQSLVRKLSTNPLFQNVNIQSTIQQLNLSYMDILQNLLNSVTNSLGSVVNTIVNTVFILIMTPVFLVYFLVDGKKLLPMLERTILRNDKLHISSLLISLNETVLAILVGFRSMPLSLEPQPTLAIVLLDWSTLLVFAIFSGLANLIPYVGPTIGLIPMIITMPSQIWIWWSKRSHLHVDYPADRWEYSLSAYRWRRDEGSPDYHYGSLIALQVISTALSGWSLRFQSIRLEKKL